MPFKTIFLLSVVFLWAFIVLSKNFERKILENISGKPKPIWGWLLIGTGIVFSCMHVGALPFMYEQQDPFGTIFMWFATNGIFSVATLSLVYGVFKCIRELKTRS